jgi:ferredoxin
MSEDLVSLVIDRNECIGFGECVSEDPAAVEIGDDGCAHALVAISPMLRRRRRATMGGASLGDPIHAQAAERSRQGRTSDASRMAIRAGDDVG